uniref:tRNA-binding domain-containing protein n=1 Tax=Polytomella parva TaxID=51329 RepID=A0A7S0VRF5_9CHLO|mmetsp:Transcript_7048/g.13875  ORF Transcript_7048/g.13875 Transcript_7048/m.13875 type:complete len:465 (+) Transcript_7048:4968-6362(+)
MFSFLTNSNTCALAARRSWKLFPLSKTSLSIARSLSSMATGQLQTALFLKSYVKDSASNVEIKDGSVVCGSNQGLSAISLFFAEQSKDLSVSSNIKNMVDEWLSFAANETFGEEQLNKVNSSLAGSTYITGHNLSVADLAVYGAIKSSASSVAAADVSKFCNLFRWLDLIQNTADAESFFPKLAVSKPVYQAPVAVAVPVKVAADKGAAAPEKPKEGEGKKKEAGEGKKKGGAAASAASAAPAAATPAAVSPAATPAAAAPVPEVVVATPPAKEAKAPKTPKEPKEAKEPKAAPAKKEDDVIAVDLLDIRVGKIVEVGRHPNADSLYLEKIDVGEKEPRQIISGLVKFVPEEEMRNRRVLVVCNLKAAKMRDVMSYGMVLCASTETHDKVEPVTPPEGVPLGERVTVPGFSRSPLDEINPKKKVLEQLFPDLKTDAEGYPVYKGQRFMTSGGAVTSGLPDGWVR